MGGSSAVRRCIFRTGTVAGLSALLAGCYTLQPASGVAPLGARVAFDINDVGRVALGGAVGPEIGTIEGRLVSSVDGDYTVAISAVKYLRGGTQVWSGEPVSIRKDFVNHSYIRQYSAGKTVVLSTALVSGLVAVMASLDLAGFGKADPPGTPPEPGTEFRGRRPR